MTILNKATVEKVLAIEGNKIEGYGFFLLIFFTATYSVVPKCNIQEGQKNFWKNSLHLMNFVQGCLLCSCDCQGPHGGTRT